MNRQNFYILVWNWKGAETKISGQTANAVCNKIGFNGTFRVEADGFRGGTWTLRRFNVIKLQFISSSAQFITLEGSYRVMTLELKNMLDLIGVCATYLGGNDLGKLGTTQAQKPFRFQAAWPSHAQFEKFLRDNWCHQIALYLALKHLAESLDKWNKMVFGNLFKHRNELWARLEGMLPMRGTKKKRSVQLISWDHVTQSKEAGGLEFRPMCHANSAFLTKLGWRLLTEWDKLWSRVLYAKYCKGRCNMDMFEPKQDYSITWQGILENTHRLKKGAKAKVGNGRRTLF
ncbi:hypothetical protein Cgig2_017653 [Carnegiea gigantea]|uniref:Uncharacterized protein n=1 Tax=Carnegiea gigantea TaxID=171969 RepID=A0A9Q1KBH3_9CARY|nr:hypothetical protein Cgig2_017653 [Carnegiea gigantea]